MKIKILILILTLASCGTNRKTVTDNDNNTQIDEIKRDIASTKEIVTVQDPPNPSLWTGKGTDSYLFTNTTQNQIGDLITIDVFKNLRTEIGTELKLEAEASGYKGPEEEKKNTTEEKKEETTEVGGDDKPSDQISAVIEQEVNDTHYILKGKKAVVFKGQKKLLEIKALVAKKDIQNNERIDSKKIKETTITVIR